MPMMILCRLKTAIRNQNDRSQRSLEMVRMVCTALGFLYLVFHEEFDASMQWSAMMQSKLKNTYDSN